MYLLQTKKNPQKENLKKTVKASCDNVLLVTFYWIKYDAELKEKVHLYVRQALVECQTISVENVLVYVRVARSHLGFYGGDAFAYRTFVQNDSVTLTFQPLLYSPIDPKPSQNALASNSTLTPSNCFPMFSNGPLDTFLLPYSYQNVIVFDQGLYWKFMRIFMPTFMPFIKFRLQVTGYFRYIWGIFKKVL